MCFKRNMQQNPTEETMSELLLLKFPGSMLIHHWKWKTKPAGFAYRNSTRILFQNAAIVYQCLQTLVTIWGMDCGAELRYQQQIQNPGNYKWGNMSPAHVLFTLCSSELLLCATDFPLSQFWLWKCRCAGIRHYGAPASLTNTQSKGTLLLSVTLPQMVFKGKPVRQTSICQCLLTHIPYSSSLFRQNYC